MDDFAVGSSDTPTGMPIFLHYDPQVFYVLTDLVEDELGLVHTHHPDYAYSPAVVQPPKAKKPFPRKRKERRESLYGFKAESTNVINAPYKTFSSPLWNLRRLIQFPLHSQNDGNIF